MAVTYEDFLILAKKHEPKSYPIFDKSEWNWSGVKNPLKFYCQNHGEFETSPFNFIHNMKYGCPACAIEERSKKTINRNNASQITLEEHITRFRLIHGEKYTYFEQEFKNSHSKIKIICKIHGEFEQHIHSHLKGAGCLKCKKEEITTRQEAKRKSLNRGIHNTIAANKRKALSIEEVLNRFIDKFSDTFEYDFSTYVSWTTPMRMTCKKHGVFLQSPDFHYDSTHGCPLCSNSNMSFKEKKWLDYLHVEHRQYKITSDGTTIKVDGYDSYTNTIYEFLGDYWHGNPNRKDWDTGTNQRNKQSFIQLFEGTQDRFNSIASLGYSIQYLWEYDYDNKLLLQRSFNGKLEW